MGKKPYICDKTGLKRGAWTPEEDNLLSAYVRRCSHWNWREIPKYAGLSRCGKSCRLRWLNYLRPNLKRGNYTQEEDEAIINLHQKLGNRWSVIAASLPGRTDNEIKNHWHTHLRKKSKPNAASKEPKQKPVKRETLMEKHSVLPNSLHPDFLKTLILESSALLPMSPPKSRDFSVSVSSNSGSEVVNTENQETTDEAEIPSDGVLDFPGDFWTQPFLLDDDAYMGDDQTSTLVDPLFVIPFSPVILYEDGYDMDIFVDQESLNVN